MKIQDFVLTSIVGASLAGCQSPAQSDTSSTSTSKPSTSTKKLRIGVTVPSADHGWMAGVGYWAKESAKKYPDAEIVVQDAGEASKQVNQLENFKTQGVDAVVIMPVDGAAVTPIAKQLKAAGIKVIDVSAGLSEEGVADIFLEGDNKAFGKMAAEFMVKRLNGKGKIVYLEGLPITANTDRVNAAKAVFAANPGIEVVGSAVADWNREKAEKQTENLLTQNPKIDAIWAADDDMALGAEAALKAQGRTKDIWILGGGGMKDIVKRVLDKDPMFPGDITYPPSMISDGISAALTLLKAKTSKTPAPAHIVIDLHEITPENAKDFYFPDSTY